MPVKQLSKHIYPQNQVFKLVTAFVVVCLTFNSCSTKVELKDFDSATWKKDFDACSSFRSNNVQKIMDQKETLIGLHETSVTQLLGKPNQLDLGKKMTRSAFYVIENSNCNKNTGEKYLVIDFNSMSQVKLVMIQGKK